MLAFDQRAFLNRLRSAVRHVPPPKRFVALSSALKDRAAIEEEFRRLDFKNFDVSWVFKNRARFDAMHPNALVYHLPDIVVGILCEPGSNRVLNFASGLMIKSALNCHYTTPELIKCMGALVHHLSQDPSADDAQRCQAQRLRFMSCVEAQKTVEIAPQTTMRSWTLMLMKESGLL